MVGGVVEQFRVNHPLVPIQLLHDGVQVVPEAVELARAAIQAEFGAIGLIPSIKPDNIAAVTYVAEAV